MKYLDFVYWKQLVIPASGPGMSYTPNMFIAKPVYEVRRTRLANSMIPEHKRDVTQVYVDSIGGKAWINVPESEIITREQAEQAGLLPRPKVVETPKQQTPSPRQFPQLKGDPHRDLAFEALLGKRRLR